MEDKRKKLKTTTPSQEFINFICSLYNDVYDNREEDSKPGDEDWVPREKAMHQSLGAFRKELKDAHNVELSTVKIRKILFTGECWTTERSREVAELYERYHSISRVALELGVSNALVTMYLPYEKNVYDLDDKSGNAKRIERWRKKKEEKMCLSSSSVWFYNLASISATILCSMISAVCLSVAVTLIYAFSLGSVPDGRMTTDPLTSEPS